MSEQEDEVQQRARQLSIRWGHPIPLQLLANLLMRGLRRLYKSGWQTPDMCAVPIVVYPNPGPPR